jgi:phosphate transport system substrate-binding protein
MCKFLGKLTIALCVTFLGCAAHAQDLRIVGASTVALPVTDAGAILKKEQAMTLQISPVVNASADKIHALGENLADIALFARPLTAADRAPYPDIDFKEIQFGEEAAALVVSHDVWDAGVHSLTVAQARSIYEQKIKNWKQVGGPDLPITFYTPEPARGIWACYIQWIYDDPTNMRESHFSIVKSDDDARMNLESTPGALALASLLFAENHHLNILAIKGDNGKQIEPIAANIANHTYPMVRPLLMVVKGRPLGYIETFAKFMVGDRGQDLLSKYNYLTLKEIGLNPPTF